MIQSLSAQGFEFYRWSKRHPIGEIPAEVAKEGAGENRIPFTHYANSVPVYLTFLDLLRKQKKKNASVLDLGCGTGRNISFVKETVKNDYEFFGIDYSVACIDYAKSQYGKIGVEYLQHNGKQLPFPSESFDFLVSSHVLEHISKEDADTYVDEISRVLRKGGIAIIGTPNRAHCQDLFCENPTEEKKYRLVLPHLHEYYFQEISRLFKGKRQFKKTEIWQTTNAICRELMVNGARAIRPGSGLWQSLKFEIYSLLRQNSFFQDFMAKFGSEILISRMRTDYKQLLRSTILSNEKPQDGDNFIVIVTK